MSFNNNHLTFRKWNKGKTNFLNENNYLEVIELCMQVLLEFMNGGIFSSERAWALITGRRPRDGPPGCLWSLPFASLSIAKCRELGEKVFTHSGLLTWLDAYA